MEGSSLNNWLVLVIIIGIVVLIIRCVCLSSPFDEKFKIVTLPRELPTHYRYGVAEAQGRRPYMEDRYLVASHLKSVPDASLYAVFDGHAGHQAAQFCAENLVNALIWEPTFPSAPAAALTAAFEKTDAAFLSYARSARLDDGCTAIAVLVLGQRAFIANAGDSRAILVKRTGGIEPLSDDHKPNRPDELARIKSLGGSVLFHGVWRVNGILAVSRAVGDRILKPVVTAKPEIKMVTLGPADKWIVIATDGLWDVFSHVEVAQLLLRSKDHHEAAFMLVNAALQRGSADNITAMVIDVSRIRTEEDDMDATEVKQPPMAHAEASRATSLQTQDTEDMQSEAEVISTPLLPSQPKQRYATVLEGVIAGIASPHVKLIHPNNHTHSHHHSDNTMEANNGDIAAAIQEAEAEVPISSPQQGSINNRRRAVTTDRRADE